MELGIPRVEEELVRPVANTDTKLLIYGLFQKGRVLAQDGVMSLKMGWGMFLKNTPSSGVMILTNHNESTISQEHLNQIDLRNKK